MTQRAAWRRRERSQRSGGSSRRRETKTRASPVESPFRPPGQVYDEESGLSWTRFRFFDAGTGRWLSADPLGLAGGLEMFGFDGAPTSAVDPLGLACKEGSAQSKKDRNIVFRYLSAEDRAALDAGLGLTPRGAGGTIVDHVQNKPTGHISASLTQEAAELFDSRNGMIEIDVREAIRSRETTFTDHGNVMQAVNSRGSLEDRKNAKRAQEVLFNGPIPASAIRRIR